MRRKKRNSISLVIILILSIGIGYALLTQELTINGVGKIQSNTWDIHFENVKVNSNSVSLSSGDKAAIIDTNTKTSVSYVVTLNKPGDFYEFTVDAVNKGSIDGMIESISSKFGGNEITEENPLPSYLNYTITYKDDVKLQNNHILKAGKSETYKVRLEFKKDITSDQLLDSDQSFEFNFSVNYIQADNNAKVRKINVEPQTLYLYSDDLLNLNDKSQKANVSMHFNNNTNDVYYAKAKLQGTSSLNYPKKNYTITFYSDEGYQTKQKVDVNKGWGAQSKYHLKANWIDSTQSRNIVSARLAAQMQSKYNLFTTAPNNGLTDGFFVELYVNDEYLGLYTMNIPKDEWMFNMDSDNPNHIVMGAEDPNRNSSTTFDKLAESEADWEIVVGPSDTPEDVTATLNKLNRVIGFVKDSTNEEFREHLSEYIDLDSLLNYYVFMALSNAVDNMSKNMLLVTYDGQIWYPNLYDLDTTWGLCFDGACTYSSTNRVTDYGGGSSILFKKLVECFPQELQQRYFELRNTVLSNDNIISEFNNFLATATQEQWDREHEKWPNIPSMSYDINQIKTHVLERGNYMDSFMTTLYHSPVSYSDQRILYKLNTPFIGGVNKFLDTGVNLYNNNESDRHATILVKYKSDTTAHENATIFSNKSSNYEHESPNGILFKNSYDGDDAYTTFWMGDYQYEALYRLADSNYQTVIITLNGNQYNIYHSSLSNKRTITSSISKTVDNNIILGGDYFNIPEHQCAEKFFKGEIKEFIVYNEVLSDTEINNLFSQYNS